MTDNIDFKLLWNKQKVEIPETKELIKKARKFKKKKLHSLILSNVILMITSVFIGAIWYYYQPELLSTKIGVILCIIAMLVYMIFANTFVSLLVSKSIEGDVKTELKQLLIFKKRQRLQQTVLLNVYFSILSLGLGLYMYEYAARMTVFGAVLAYGIVAFWIALNVFYFRPRIVKKQQGQLNKLIDKLKGMNEQLEEI